MEGGGPRSTLASPPLSWEAAVLGAAFVALVLGAGGLAVALYHYYRKEGKGLSPSLRAAQLYESVRIRPVVVEEAVVGGMPKEAKSTKSMMSQEAKSTKTKTMSYEVNPESCHI